MGSKKFAVVSNEKLKELLFALFQHYVVIAPIRELPEKSPILAKLDENDLERLELNDRALVPFKFSFQPLRDTLFTYTFNKNVVNISYEIKEEKRLLLLGLRGCELKALEITDLVMLEDPADPFYKVRRENTILISLDCVNPFSSCFCTELGGKPYPEKGYDLNLSPVEGGYLIEVGSLKGWELLKPLQLFFSEPGEQCLLQRNKQREESYTKLKSFYSKPLKELSKVDENFFTNFSKKCVECSGCIYT
ncbi:MAG: hypothetical protein N3E48_04390, partial [Candidatus Bathyarchaeota archaeon]|nr:hypothetical protein [Candidatus Bathyarchaeota archaeon]